MQRIWPALRFGQTANAFVGKLLSSLLFSHRIQFLEFIPGFRDGETTINRCPDRVPFRFPRTNFTGDDCLAGQPAIQTLVSQNRDFNFSHIQPTAMFRYIVKLQFPGKVTSLLRRKGPVKSGGRMDSLPKKCCLWLVKPLTSKAL